MLVLPAVDTIPADSSARFRVVEIVEGGDTVEISGVVWSSRDPDVASVSDDGLVTGIRSGLVTIVALVGDFRGATEVRVERRFQAKSVSTGSAGVCAVSLAGQIWCEGGWGSGLAYPDTDTTDIRTFLVPASGSQQYAEVGSNQFFACGLTVDGQVLCWGYQPLGEGLSSGVPLPIAPELTFDTLSVQGWLGCGLVAQAAYCWGVPRNGVKQVDTDGIPLVALDVQQYDACGRTVDDVQLCWDYFLDFAYPEDRSFEQPPTGDAPPLHGLVSGGDFFCGLDADGLAWCWGTNEQGQLGNGGTLNSADPVPVAGGLHFSRLSAGRDDGARRACGIADESELFCWGSGFGSVPSAVLY